MSDSFKQFLERIPLGSLLINQDGLIQYANSTLEALLGYQPEELNGTQIRLVIPDNSLENDTLTQASANNGSCLETIGRGKITKAICKDGSQINVEVLQETLADNSTDFVLTLLPAPDRDAQLEALRQTQEINKTGTWRFDLAANEVWWSPELFRIFELPITPLAPPYETHMSLFTPESWAKLEPAVTAASTEGTPYQLELQLAPRHKNDIKRVAVARCEPQLDKQGNVVQLVGTFQDITELAAARTERDQLLERLSLAKGAAGIGIWEWNIDTGEVIWDEQMCEIFNVDIPYTDYEEWRRVIHPDDLQNAEAKLQHAIDTGEILSNSYRITRDSEIRNILVFAASNDGRMIGVNMDITEQTRLREEALRASNLQSLGTLAGGIAHDFNNQLASIGARAELLALRADESDFVSQMAEELSDAVERAADLTKQLLTFAKDSTLFKESASIEELVKKNIEFSLRGTSLAVQFDFDKDLWNADIDAHQIGQVIQNIAINALQAMSQSGSKLKIQARNVNIDDSHPQLEAGRFIELSFEDNGPGMTEEVVSQIFTPYYTTKDHGHGLGLAMCHSIIGQHKGAINVSSTPGLGTKFVIYLPATTAPASNVKSATTLTTGSGNLLIVDDMEDVLQSMGGLVEALGYHCSLASNVTDAIIEFEEANAAGKPFDLVITDLTMPGSGGGVEVLEKLQVLDPDVKIIVLSGYGNNSIMSNPQSTGFAGKLQKPISLDKLSKEIHRVLQAPI